MTEDMGVVMVRNFGQGRTEQDFAVWMSSPERGEMLTAGMIEITLENAGALVSDLATELGISIAQMAIVEPEMHALDPRKKEIARKYLNARFRLFVARWLGRQVTAFEQGFERCLKRTGT